MTDEHYNVCIQRKEQREKYWNKRVCAFFCCINPIYSFRASFYLFGWPFWWFGILWNKMTRFNWNMGKRTFLHVRPTKTKISLRIRAVWSEYTLSIWRNFAYLVIQNAPREDSDLTARMHRLIWISAGRTCPKVCFRLLRLNLNIN